MAWLSGGGVDATVVMVLAWDLGLLRCGSCHPSHPSSTGAGGWVGPRAQRTAELRRAAMCFVACALARAGLPLRTDGSWLVAGLPAFLPRCWLLSGVWCLAGFAARCCWGAWLVRRLSAAWVLVLLCFRCLASCSGRCHLTGWLKPSTLHLSWLRKSTSQKVCPRTN